MAWKTVMLLEILCRGLQDGRRARLLKYASQAWKMIGTIRAVRSAQPICSRVRRPGLKLVYSIGALAALATSCGRGGPGSDAPRFTELDCTPRSVTVTGRLEKDIVGSWDSFGIDTQVVFTFHPDRGITAVGADSPYGKGGISSFQYRVLDGGVSIDSIEYSASISESSLTLESGGVPRVHPALSCRGKGFE